MAEVVEAGQAQRLSLAEVIWAVSLTLTAQLWLHQVVPLMVHSTSLQSLARKAVEVAVAVTMW